MRLAVVIPYLNVINGNKPPIRFVNKLSAEGVEIDLVVHTMRRELRNYLENSIGQTNLIVLKATDHSPNKITSFFKSEFSHKYAIDLSYEIKKRHSEKRYDFIIQYGNEGRDLALEIKKWKSVTPPKIGLVVMELVDHVFLRNGNEGFSVSRTLLFPFYKLVHHFEYMKFKAYDSLLSISTWTSILLMYFYGLRSESEFIFYDETEFFVNHSINKENYIIVPTASLSIKYRETVSKLYKDGINLITYGNLEVSGVPHLGYLPEEEMKTRISRARALLFLFDYEAFGLIPLESLALGTPVITIPKDGPFIYLKDNKCTYFVNNYSEILEKCKDVSNEAWLDKNPVNLCNESVSNFRLSIYIKKFTEYLENILD